MINKQRAFQSLGWVPHLLSAVSPSSAPSLIYGRRLLPWLGALTLHWQKTCIFPSAELGFISKWL